MARARSSIAVNKLVVTHRGALRRKHGGEGLARVEAALRDLAEADTVRGIHTRLVAMDDGRTARAVSAPDVDDPTDHEATKAFVDAACMRWRPEYVVLLGSPDVVPLQPLRNPLWTGDPRSGDADETVPSDLPYACTAPHSLDPGRFRGATRVVGRLPDGTGSTDPAHLLRLLDVAARYRSRRRAAYLPPFAVTARDWRGSTRATLAKLIGSADGLQDVPSASPPWQGTQTRRRLHLVNLHGAAADWRYYGQRGTSYPVALDATALARGRALTEGTVGAAECCYGGMLFDPAETDGIACFVDTYLAAGAYGYCASSTVSYGPTDANDCADLVCRSFLQHVLAGCSTGRALLQARQDYVFTKATLSPFDLKTLAQFSLFGDPSIHPVARSAVAAPVGVEAAAPVQKGRGHAVARKDPTSGIAARRRRLRANGLALEATTTRAALSARDLDPRERDGLAAELAVAAPGRSSREAVVRSFDVVAAPEAQPGPVERFHLLLDRRPTGMHAVLARSESGTVQQLTALRER